MLVSRVYERIRRQAVGFVLAHAFLDPRALCSAVFKGSFADGGQPAGTRLRVVSWNVAAVNNNPFEYWITHPNPAYKELMESVEQFIIAPGEEDVRVDQVFTDKMFRRVLSKMQDVGMKGLPEVEAMWESTYRARRVVSEFLRDGEIGKKRLASMPDRVTNTIQLPSGASLFRPAVGNCYAGSFATLDEWFEQWMAFFFDGQVDLDGKGPRPVYSLLQKIKRSKYPAVTEEEEAVSIPLQLVLQGVFDATLVNLMQARGGETWQVLRREICDSLNSRKNDRLREILETTYMDADVIFLQEAGNQLVELLKASHSKDYLLVLPKAYSAKRNQNSVMLLRSSLFSSVEEFDVEARGWEEGDLLTVRALVAGMDVTLASFHGDTNGLLTMPMLSTVMEQLPTKALLFGMDANTYERVSKSTAHVLEFETLYRSLNLQSCWGEVDPTRYTTFNARTHLQPQLNKAAKSTELAEKGDRNPKDFVLFTEHFTQGGLWRDNTGTGTFEEGMVFPTLEFPSDHAALAVDLVLAEKGRTEL
uniref:Endonuclease/exonuclease/phosphatase domain-containing protein n=1 Tax=Alexandrium catenella TaxID=2925 RepID=A0A7S1WEK8_ALECA|mmetsp:Transcript_5491/g.14587  ORF Transcript_5491/g.14587 Transcript_5491/m.14587 type:complete len:532 (+) Transcript_5491:46-1641(+)